MTVERVFNKYYVCGKTDCGRNRSHNEDNISINSNTALFMVADGMGGHLYGDRASLEAVTLIDRLVERHLHLGEKKTQTFTLWEKLINFFYRTDNSASQFDVQMQIVADILIETNASLYRFNQDENFIDGCGMGTTVVGCLLSEEPAKMLVFHVGDSRLYRLRNNRLTQITKDHSAYQFWLDNGQVGKQPSSNVILQGIGPTSSIQPEVRMIDIEEGDGFLLCSDGLTDMVDDRQVEEVIQDLYAGNIEDKVEKLVDIANNNGGSDNISVILICQ